MVPATLGTLIKFLTFAKASPFAKATGNKSGDKARARFKEGVGAISAEGEPSVPRPQAASGGECPGRDSNSHTLADT